MVLNFGNQPVDFSPVIDIDQELDERPILSLRAIDEQESQAAAADEAT